MAAAKAAEKATQVALVTVFGCMILLRTERFIPEEFSC
jgi:hypothetical protein